MKAIFPSALNGTGVSVGGTGVFVAVGMGVGGTGVFVAVGMGVGGTGVFVAVGLGVGGTGVAVGGFDVGAEGGTIAVDSVAVVPQPLSTDAARMNPIPQTDSFLFISCSPFFSIYCADSDNSTSPVV